MSDIVEHLRKHITAQEWPTLQDRAADEITRLREENARLREAVKAAYYEGWQDRESIIATGERLDFDWNCSEARYAIREGRKEDE